MSNAADGSTRRRRWRWMVPVGVGVLLLGWIAVRQLLGPVVPAVQVKRGPLSQKVVVSGRVTPPAEIQIGSTLSGTVLAVHVDEGDVVEPGAALVEIDAKELDAAVAQAEASVLQSRARLNQLLKVVAPAQAEAVRQAELAVDQAKRRAERARTLAKAGGLSESDLEEALNALALAESRAEGARAQASGTSRAGAEIRGAEATLAQADAQLAAARARRAQATLTAPAKAQVLRREVEPGDAISPGATLLVLARIGATRLSVEPDEKNLAFIRPDQPALASADAFPDDRFEARVERIAPAVNPDRGTVEVKLLVSDPPDYLRPEMTVSVEIEVAARPSAIALPSAAIQDAGSKQPWVLRVEAGRAKRADVKIGLTGEGQVEIVSGVSEGDVVLLPKTKLAPGKRVRPSLQEG